MTTQPPRPIFIIGQPGAGKGLLAKTLAEKLGWHFVNADLGLEQRIGLSLTNIISSEGAQTYLSCQHQILQSLLTKPQSVITTDGSACDNDDCCHALQQGFVIFLDVSLTTQLNRLSVSAEPLHPNANTEQLLKDLHQQRDARYQNIADYTLCSDDNALDEHVQSIIEVFGTESHSNAQPLTNELTFLHQQTYQPVKISQRQLECLALVADGNLDKQIAVTLQISVRTVEDHINNLKKSLGCPNSKALIALYHQQQK